MTNKLLYLSIPLVLCISCRETTTPKVVSSTSVNPTVDTLVYDVNTLSKKATGCDEEGKPCIKSNLQYIVVAGGPSQKSYKKINETILNAVKEDAASIEENLENFIADGQASMEEFTEAPPTGEYIRERIQSVIYNTSDILAIEEFDYSYTGGAHGNYGTSYYNFDVNSGSKIQLQDIFINDYESPLKAMAEQIFKQTYLEGQTNFSDAGFQFENNEFILPNNFAITKEGVKFLYGLYEIAPYALGQQEILLPFPLLKDLIKPNGLLSKMVD